MKNYFESFLSAVIIMLTVYISLTLFSIESESIQARALHSDIIETIQTSNYNFDIDKINEKIQLKHPTWYATVQDLGAINTRKNFLVTLYYDLPVSFFDTVKDGVIEGYAR